MGSEARKLEEKVLFTPGPVMVPDAVRRVFEQPDIGHRRPQFEAILHDVRERLLRLYNADDRYTAAVISGSGTAANETVINSLSHARFLVINNGEFGNRLEEILSRHGADYETLEYDWGVLPDADDVDAALGENPDVDVVALPYHETSTAMINPIGDIGEVCEKHGAYLYADTISAIGGEDIDVLRDGIDIATGVSNKAVASIPGCSFVCLRREVIDELRPRSKTVYLDLEKHVRYADERSQTPNTPAVQAIMALDVALETLLDDEGVDERLDRHRRCAAILRDGIEEIAGLSVLFPRESMANTLTTVALPDGVDLDSVIDALDERGYVVYPGKGPLYDRGAFQVGNMGEIYETDCRGLLRALEATIEEVSPTLPE